MRRPVPSRNPTKYDPKNFHQNPPIQLQSGASSSSPPKDQKNNKTHIKESSDGRASNSKPEKKSKHRVLVEITLLKPSIDWSSRGSAASGPRFPKNRFRSMTSFKKMRQYMEMMSSLLRK